MLRRGSIVKRHISFLLFVCAWPVIAVSQAVVPASTPVAHLPSLPAGEVYTGFQWEHFDLPNFLGLPPTFAVPHHGFLGFRSSGSFALHGWLGAEGEISRDSQSYKNFFTSGDKLALSSLTIMGGPRVTYHLGPLTQFAHLMLGLYRSNSAYTDPVSASTTSASANAFAFALGGGTSFRVSRHFGIATTADYIRPSKSGVALNNIRVSVGPVFYFGGTKGEVPRYAPYTPAPSNAPVRRVPPAPPRERQCIEYMIDSKGNETCLRYGGPQ
jgi:opacity protein-like surface antigen